MKPWQKPRRRKPSLPIISDGVVGIPLTQKLTAWLDEEDYHLVKGYVWCAAKHGHTYYAKTTRSPHRTTYMHDLIMLPPEGLEVDHINGNGLMCCRWNLRNVSHSVNMQNSRRCHGQACLRETVVLGEFRDCKPPFATL